MQEEAFRIFKSAKRHHRRMSRIKHGRDEANGRTGYCRKKHSGTSNQRNGIFADLISLAYPEKSP